MTAEDNEELEKCSAGKRQDGRNRNLWRKSGKDFVRRKKDEEKDLLQQENSRKWRYITNLILFGEWLKDGKIFQGKSKTTRERKNASGA